MQLLLYSCLFVFVIVVNVVVVFAFVLVFGLFFSYATR